VGAIIFSLKIFPISNHLRQSAFCPPVLAAAENRRDIEDNFLLCGPMHSRSPVRSHLTLCLAVLIALGSSCKGDPTAPEPVKSLLSCAQSNGQLIRCDLLLEQSGGFTITLTNRECRATGNTLTLTKPTAQLLTADACALPVGQNWSFPGPYPVGTPVSLEIVSAKQPHPATLVAAGSYPSWTLTFEDGFDQDLNDLVLVLQAEPSMP
jgi:hypothetical protein